MKWYWIVLTIYAYIIIGCVIAAVALGSSDDDAFLAIAIFWPILVIIIILALPIKLILNILNLR